MKNKINDLKIICFQFFLFFLSMKKMIFFNLVTPLLLHLRADDYYYFDVVG
jgi:hypothetical protein